MVGGDRALGKRRARGIGELKMGIKRRKEVLIETLDITEERRTRV
jgi:hypothetical protein